MDIHDPPSAEEQLIQRCLDGDLSAYHRMYEQHKEVMYNVAFRLHQNVQDAEDSMQDAFMKVFKALPDFRGDCRLSTWIYRILLNTCFSRLKKNRGPVVHAEDIRETGPASLPGPAEEPSTRMILEEEIAHLPLGYRTVFVLYEVEGFTHQEIADMLAISVGSSKSQLHKAKRILQGRLQPYREMLETNR